MPQLPFVGPAYEAFSKSISAQEAVNVYVEAAQEAAPALLGVPGTIERVDLGEAIRALYPAFGTLYAVAGDKVYSVSSGWVATELGTVANDGLPACMTHNIFELLVVSGLSGYTVQKTTEAFAEVTDTDFPQSNRCGFIDGYGILLEKNSGRFWFTDIDDFETISGIDFATAEGAPDDLVSLIIDHREVWLFGDQSTEVWTNVGNASNPFQRVPGGFIEKGCRAAQSPAKLDNTVFWLGDDGVVYRADGLRPQRVSNHAVEYLIAGQESSLAIGMAYNQYGHAFYQLSMPSLTMVYDASTGAWHRRKTRGFDHCVYQHHARAYGVELVGGTDGKLYQLDKDTYTHAGELERIRTIGPIRTNGFTSMSSLTFLFETGENDDAVDASKVFIEISDDGGKTFSPRIEGSIGRQGDYRTEVKFHALGGFYDNERVIRLTMTDDAKYTLVDSYAA